MKQLRLIVTIPVEGEISLAALRSHLKEVVRIAGAKPIAYRKPTAPEKERVMKAHFAQADVRSFGRRAREPHS
jgi:hypothetical protein